MDLYDFFNTFTTAVAKDVALDLWAMAHFGHHVTVYPDLDFSNPPDSEDDTPYVIFHSPGKRSGQEMRTIDYGMELWLVLNKSTHKTRAEDNITEPAGVELISDFITKTQAAIVAALPANFMVDFEVVTDTIGMIPEIHGHLACEFMQRLVIGQDPLG